jgi:hypothetical protein
MNMHLYIYINKLIQIHMKIHMHMTCLAVASVEGCPLPMSGYDTGEDEEDGWDEDDEEDSWDDEDEEDSWDDDDEEDGWDEDDEEDSWDDEDEEDSWDDEDEEDGWDEDDEDGWDGLTALSELTTSIGHVSIGIPCNLLLTSL